MNRYDVFLTVVQTGSFTRAAAELGYSQSAVSQMVRTLEQELAATLIERGKHGAVLTPDGQAYLPYLQALSTAFRGLEEKRRELTGLFGSVIRIGTFTSVSRNWLPQWMSHFRQLYPGVHFVLRQGEYTMIERWVREGSVDFGFVNPAAVSGLELTALCRDRMLAVLPQGHPLAAQPRVSLLSLSREPFILLDEGASSVPLAAFAAVGLQPDVQFQVYDDYTILPMVQQGLGVSVMYELVLRGLAQDVALRELTTPVERTIALAWRSRSAMPIAARRFVDFMLNQPLPNGLTD